MKIKKGTMLVISTGEYSNFTIHTLCKALQDIDTEVVKQEYLLVHPEEGVEYHANFYRFMKWIIVDKQLVEEIVYGEWYVGSYSTLESTFEMQDKADIE